MESKPHVVQIDWSAPPAEPPRPLTPAASRASWRDSRVRLRMVLAAFMLLLGIGYSAIELVRSYQARWFVNNGRLVEKASISGLGVASNAGPILIVRIPGSTLSRQDRPIAEVKFELDGKEYTVQGPLKSDRDQVAVGQELPIRVDPADPKRWTDRVSYSTLGDTMALILLAPVALVLAAVALLRRRRVLGLWQSAPAVAAAVVGVSQSPFTPDCWVVKVALKEGRDRRVFTVTAPRRLGALGHGDTLWLLATPQRPHDAIVAAAFV